jgi:hypothetical protein
MARAHRLHYSIAVAVLLAAIGCGSARRDLQFVKSWDRGVTIYPVAEWSGLPDQSSLLGSVRAGATGRFAQALPAQAESFRFRVTYAGSAYGPETFTLCVTRDALERSNWSLMFLSTPYSCH